MPLKRADRLIRIGVVTYICALALIAAFSIAFYFITDRIVVHQTATASVVNLSGRQRMLSQRIAKLTLERASRVNFRPDSQSQAVLLRSIQQMTEAHKALLYGSDELHQAGPASQSVRDIYLKAPWSLDYKVQEFLGHATALANKPVANLSLSDPDLIAVQMEAQAPLLDALNAAVTANQETSERSIRTLRKVLTSLTLMMLIILMLEALFLYRPLFRKLAKANSDLLEAGRTDPLTGCLNRRAFMEEAQVAVKYARGQRVPLAVMMLDIDRFKNVNDRHGHPVGDRVINCVVGTLLNSIRETDVLCRMGGEEFAIMLPGDQVAAAAQIGERIRAAVAALTIPLTEDGEFFLTITISIGVAGLEEADASLFEVLGRADKGLYRAKTLGRNQVQIEVNKPSPEAEVIATLNTRAC